MEADPSVYHLPPSGREEITVFPGTPATTDSKMPTQRLLREIPLAFSSFVNPFLLGRAPCTGSGFCSIRCWDPQASPSHGAGMGGKDSPCAHLALGNKAMVPWGDGLLLPRSNPSGGYSDFFSTLVQDFPVSWCSRAVPARRGSQWSSKFLLPPPATLPARAPPWPAPTQHLALSESNPAL